MTSRRSRPWAPAGLVIAFALLAAACGGTDADSESESSAAGGGTSEMFDSAVFSGQATTVAGDSFDLGTLADKDLVVWFWAPW